MTPVYINGYEKEIPLRNKSEEQILASFIRYQKDSKSESYFGSGETASETFRD